MICESKVAGTWRRGVVSVAFVVGMMVCVWGSARAVVIPPGGGPTPLAGSPGFVAGTVIEDTTTPFTIYVSGTSGPVLFQGALQHRVVRLASGDLAFGYRIRDTVGGFNGNARYVNAGGFASFGGSIITDCDWDPTSIGDRSPQFGSRSADGQVVQFDFGTALFAGPLTSRFMYVKTNARSYTTGGTVQIVTSSGQLTTVGTYRPVIDTTAPIAEITSPGALACVCNPVEFVGTARDADGTPITYTLVAQRANAVDEPITIATSSSPVNNGVLGTWNTNLRPQGYYTITLTVTNAAGLTATDTTFIFVDRILIRRCFVRR